MKGPSGNSGRDVGAAQEARASGYLTAKGWKLLAQNYCTRSGEVDLIFRDPEQTVVFVEVKFRTGTSFGLGQEMVNWSKQKRIAKAALVYLKEKKLTNQNLRFDVIALSPEGVEHIPNAFSPEGYSL